MNIKTVLPTVLLLALSTCLLTGCGGGGGGAMVRAESTPPAPPPPPAPTEVCAAPVTADCTVTTDGGLDWTEGTPMTGGRQSDYALIVNGGGILHMKDTNRFSGGLSILEGATVMVWDSLTADIHIASPSDTWGRDFPQLWLVGTVNGTVVNDGTVSLMHDCGTGVYQCDETHHPVINGDYRQSASGQLEVVLGWNLQVTGSSELDGKLQLLGSKALNYVLPTAPTSVLVLHADGGVSGQFDSWFSENLFLSGSLRYLSNDVYFDATTISAAQAMATAKAGDAITLQSAGHFDAALVDASRWATPGAMLTLTQRQFLASVGAIQRLQDYDQAVRSFDSLSGHGYADAADSLLQHAAMPAPELMGRIGNLRTGLAAGSWTTQSAMLASGGGAFSGQLTGFDQWLGDRLLLGSSVGWSEGSLRFDRAGGSARDQSPQWDVYARHNADGNVYVFGDIGYSRHQLDLNRQIDLGVARSAAGARHSFAVTHAYLETGRDVRAGQGWLTPFAAVSYAMLQDAGFTEHGNTGFELIAQPATHRRFSATAGLRLGADWQATGGRRTRLNLAAGYRQLLDARDDARAGFSGAPEVVFALDGMPQQRNTGWMQMSLASGGANWNWLLNYDRQASDQALSLGANFRF